MTNETRDYGGWRIKQGLGFFGLSPIESGVAFACGAAVMGTIIVNKAVILPVVVASLLVVGSMIRLDGIPMWAHIHAEYRLILTTALGQGEFLSRYYSGGAEGAVADLPGSLGTTTTYEVNSASGESYGVVWNSATETATVTWKVHPHTPHLADQSQVDVWVSSWHQFLASLGYINQLAHVMVTVVTATEPGAIVSENLDAYRAANAPKAALALLDELAVRETDGTTTAQTLISVTFDTRYGPAAREQDPRSRIEQIVGLVSAMNRDIRTCGLASAALLSVAELSATTKGAFTPSLRKPLAEALRRGETDPLQWHISGPVQSSSERFYYRHDDAITMGWVMAQPPRGHVTEEVLYNLMSPGMFPKRVTFVWNPTPADKAARIIEAERTLSEAKRLVKSRGLSDETARDEYDRQMTDMAAVDEARGAGLGDFAIFVTSTIEVSADITDEQLDYAMDAASVEVESRAKQSKMLVRPAIGCHDLLLFSSLPAGINPTTIGKRS